MTTFYNVDKFDMTKAIVEDSRASGGASEVQEPGHFKVRKTSSQVTPMAVPRNAPLSGKFPR